MNVRPQRSDLVFGSAFRIKVMSWRVMETSAEMSSVQTWLLKLTHRLCQNSGRKHHPLMY